MSVKKIIAIIIITIIAVIGVIGGIAFSFSDTSVSVGDTTLDQNITRSGLINPTYSGFIEARTDVAIYNSGVLNIEDLTVHIIAYFISDIDPNTKHKVGEDTNNLGTIPAGENTTNTITIRLTEKVTRLAVEDGIIELEMEISLKIQYVTFYILEFEQTTTEEHNAPFTPF